MAIGDDALFNQFVQEMEASWDASDDNQKLPQEEEHPTADQETQEVPESDDTEADTGEETTEEETPEEKWTPETLEEIAQAFELDEDAIKAIKIKTKIDGKEGEATLRDIIKNYQLDKALTERAETLAHMRKEYEQRFTQWEHAYAEKMQFADAFTGIMENNLRQQVAAVDWKQLREEDPAEYAAKRQEFTERIGELESIKARIAQQRAVDTQQARENQLAALKQLVDENVKKLPELIPEFKKGEVMRQQMGELKEYLRSTGFAKEEIESVFDARQIVIARKAMLYDQMLKKGATKQAQVKTPPKFVKPSARQAKVNVDAEKIQQRAKQLKRTGSVHDFAALIMDTST